MHSSEVGRRGPPRAEAGSGGAGRSGNGALKLLAESTWLLLRSGSHKHKAQKMKKGGIGPGLSFLAKYTFELKPNHPYPQEAVVTNFAQIGRCRQVTIFDTKVRDSVRCLCSILPSHFLSHNFSLFNTQLP